MLDLGAAFGLRALVQRRLWALIFVGSQILAFFLVFSGINPMGFVLRPFEKFPKDFYPPGHWNFRKLWII